MSGYDAMQWTIIVLAIVASAIYAMGKLAPNAVRRARTMLALMFLQPNAGRFERHLGRWLAPKPQSSGACGSTSCSGCGDAQPAPPPRRAG